MSYEIRAERLLNTTPEVASHQWISPEGRKQWFTGEQSDRGGGRRGRPAGRRPLLDHLYFIGGTAWREEGTFAEVDQPTRLVYGSLTTPLPDEGEPLETRVTITSRARGGKTLLTVVETGYPTEEMRDAIEPFVVEGVEYFARSIPGRRDRPAPARPQRRDLRRRRGHRRGGGPGRPRGCPGVPGRAHPGLLDLVAGDIRRRGHGRHRAGRRPRRGAAVDAHAEAIVAEAACSTSRST